MLFFASVINSYLLPIETLEVIKIDLKLLKNNLYFTPGIFLIIALESLSKAVDCGGCGSFRISTVTYHV